MKSFFHSAKWMKNLKRKFLKREMFHLFSLIFNFPFQLKNCIIEEPQLSHQDIIKSSAADKKIYWLCPSLLQNIYSYSIV